MTIRSAILGAALMSAIVADVRAKTTQTYFSPQELQTIRDRAKDPRYAKEVDATIRAAGIIADLSDQEVWDLVPPADLTRALNVRYEFDCPVHGKEIFKVGGRWPWITKSDKPFVLECPVGHETYPSNDFNAYLKAGRKEKLDVHQKYVDDGNGYLDEEGHRYFFVGYYNFWHRWRKTLVEGVSACSNAYLLTGDPKYAHKAAIALTAISRVYPQMDYSTQAYHNGKWPAAINGRILDYIWENQVVAAYTVAYDAIYPTIENDEALKELAAKNGVADPRLAIEKDILGEMAKDLLEKKIWGNKFELRSTASVALVLDNHDPAKGPTQQQMIEWLLKGGGDMEFTFYNGFDRDGWGGESSLGYSGIWNAMSVSAADDMARMGVKMATDPKWRKLAKAPIEMRLLDNLIPRIGDVNGDIKGTERGLNDELSMFGVSHFNDADCAASLLRNGSFKPPLFTRYQVNDEQLKALAAKATLPPPPYTRDLGGYGLAILEMNDGATTHSATIYYGSPMAAHGHNDRLTMSYHQGDRDIYPDLGYPSVWGASADWWVKNTTSHYAVMVDQEPQTARYAGYLTKFASGEGVRLVEAQAKSVWAAPPKPAEVPVGSIGGEKNTSKPARERAGPPVTDYRRMLTLLDTGEQRTLVIDAFTVAGGSQHDYCFHGLPHGKFSVENAKLIKEQKTGTLAGEDIELGKDPGGRKIRSGFQFLASPRWFEAVDAPMVAWRGDGELNQFTWFPKLAFGDLIVADGVPPTGPGAPDSMPFLFLRHKGEKGLQSLFLSITEAGKSDTSVAKVETIHADQPTAGGAVVTLKSGLVWKLYINAGAASAKFTDGVTSTVPFAAVQVVFGKPVVARLVGAGEITIDGHALKQDASPEMKIEKIDYTANTVTVSGDLPKEIGPQGLTVLATRDDALHASYDARSVDAANRTLGFGEVQLLTGRFEAAWDPAKKLIVSKERTGGVYNRLVATSFIGMSVVSEDRQHTAAITSYDEDNNTFGIDGDGAAFVDNDGDGRSYVYIADLAPGVTLSTTPASTKTIGGTP